MNEEMKLIERVIEEAVTMKLWGKRDGMEQYEILTMDGEKLPEGDVIIVSLDKELRVRAMTGGMSGGLLNVNALGTDNFYGELVVYYCKKKKGLFGKETLKTVKTYYKKYHIDAVENGTEVPTSLKEVIE